jgi:uncharacterized lipoprotein NlpE involved in copper resistance
MKKALILIAFALVTIITACKSKEQKPAVQGNVVNDLSAYQHPDSLAKYAVGSEHNPVKVKGK